MQQSAVFPPTILPSRPPIKLHCLNYSTQHYLRYPYGMIYIARLCIAWLAAQLKLRFMTDRRLGIQHNHVSLLCLSFTSISFVHPSCHGTYGWFETSFSHILGMSCFRARREKLGSGSFASNSRFIERIYVLPLLHIRNTYRKWHRQTSCRQV
ncbi:hypothetical protein BJY00DRAFT_203503 [Aspergillus carlsbadensis]|nr:hypothetical protein BJY00DRAFT_203503 [Aspergillus carlsbadensis]